MANGVAVLKLLAEHGIMVPDDNLEAVAAALDGLTLAARNVQDAAAAAAGPMHDSNSGQEGKAELETLRMDVSDMKALVGQQQTMIGRQQAAMERLLCAQPFFPGRRRSRRRAAAPGAGAAAGLDFLPTDTTNGNIAKSMPEIEEQAKGLLATGLPASGVSAGGLCDLLQEPELGAGVACGDGGVSGVGVQHLAAGVRGAAGSSAAAAFSCSSACREGVRSQKVFYGVEHFAGSGLERAGHVESVLRVEQGSGRLIAEQSLGSLPARTSVCSDAELLRKLPNFVCWEDAEQRWVTGFKAAGYLQGSELVAYETVFRPRMRQAAAEYMMGSSSMWLLFLLYDRDVRLKVFNENSKLMFGSTQSVFSWGTLDGVIDYRLLVKHQYALEAAKAAVSSKQPSPAAPPRQVPQLQMSGLKDMLQQLLGQPQQPQRFRRGASSGGTAGLMQEIEPLLPAGVGRNDVCLNYWQHGSCNRPECKFASKGHCCMLCGAANHGGSQCRRRGGAF
uniref:Uncharacterized protein n=1 Tax=Tetradesmus obliquus TaxID=3088 RepID=A0A383WNJ0_TETOB|eukprot:jgi/Sobl393_1/19820/SZX78833.1